MNDGYSTQNKYSRANFRTNLDIDLSPKTRMQANIMGVLNEFSRPGLGSDNLMQKIVSVRRQLSLSKQKMDYGVVILLGTVIAIQLL